MKSLTGYASQDGQGHGLRWQWELRSVNGKGLDLRVRMPDWCAPLEADLRKQVGAVATRGNISLNLRIQADPSSLACTADTLIDSDALDRTLDMMALVQARADANGVALAAPSALDILAMRGILREDARNDGLSDDLAAALMAGFKRVLADFIANRTQEGAALQEVLTRQINEISEQLDAIRALLPERAATQAEALRTNLARLTEGDGIDPVRLHQEAAVLAVKSDVTEEMDRLDAHVKAARQLIAASAAVGRKFDFLCQEFNREANTLCSKSQHSGLTELGLALKVTIDQMREQIQNVE